MPNKSATALITGASSGIGRASAIRLANDGFNVIALARRTDRLASLADEISDRRRLTTVTADVSDQNAMRDVLDQWQTEETPIDVLVNNAGLALGLDSAANASIDDWTKMLNVNCLALVWLTRQVLPDMLARGRGHIVNIGSTAGIYPYRGSNVYGASKAFVAQFTRNLRADLLGTPLRATLIEPGMVGDSEFSQVRFHGDDAKAAAVYAGTKALTPSEVADAIAWAIQQPAHVNINRIELMPVCQAADQIGLARGPGAD